MKKKEERSSFSPELLQQYDKVIAGLEGVERRGATVPYTSLGGHMFSHLQPTGLLALRLSKDDRNAFLEKHPDAVCIAYGIVMKEYVTIPAPLFSNTREMKKLFAASHRYISTLKPKATKKAAKKK